MAKFRTNTYRTYGFGAIRRDGSGTGLNDASPMQPHAGSASSTGSTPSIYLGLGAGLGGAFLIAFALVIALTVKTRRKHRRAIEALEVEEAMQMAQRQWHDIADIPQPVTSARRSTLAPLYTRAGWGALSSNEDVHDPGRATQRDRRKRSCVSLPKKFKYRGIPLKRLKRLTAIMESPRSRTTNSPALPFQDTMPTQAGAQDAAIPRNSKAYTLRKVGDDDVFVCPESPKPSVLPSFAIRSPRRYGAGIALSDNSKAQRSRSVGAMADISKNVLVGQISRPDRPPMHARSISLGAPPTRPPQGPVPPLPVIEPHETEVEKSVRQGMCVSRVSTSSQDSAGSSVLVTSPILQMHEQNKTLASPSVEEIVAADGSASLKAVAHKQWQMPRGGKARSMSTSSDKENREGAMPRTSIRGNIARYSAESTASHRLSTASTASSDSRCRRLSIPQIGTADQVSMSRVCSNTSLNSRNGVQKITTPRKSMRSSVSAYGSPAERKKTGVLRDISAKSLPCRQPSNATQESSRSSNGNPFQWDQPLQKPSALKGSPNARKGHRRQNCVRISTLTPHILGPPPSRPSSPSIMHGIAEESGDCDEGATQPGVLFVSNQRLSRPPSASSFAPNLRIQTLRASLRPSSPTLSAWTAFQEHGLPSEASDSQLSASPNTRSISRQSDCSSNFSLPRFPSPGKATVANAQLSQPVPEFCLSRPSTDTVGDTRTSPSALQISLDVEIQSSPPLPISKSKEYDPAHPAWPIVKIPAPRHKEYEPASPAWDDTEPERSSAFFPFAATSMNRHQDNEISPRSRPVSYGGDMPDTPPISPKTMPEGFQAFFDKQDLGSKPPRAAEKLTSANASAMMARLPSKVDFPSAPILPPPDEDEYYSRTTPSSTNVRQEPTWTYPMRFQPLRPAPSPPVTSSNDCMPSPLHVENKTSPQGPRAQPAHSVLKHAMALRRMNSEVNAAYDQESRRYVRLGREASPLLPWIGSPDPNYSCENMVDLFDFDFASDTGSGAEKSPSVLDEVDMTEVETKLDGAIAGFEAIPSEQTVKESRSSSVWEDGEKYWEQRASAETAFARSGLPFDVTPKKHQELDSHLLGTPKSIQNTPKSLYDSDGFLRT